MKYLLIIFLSSLVFGLNAQHDWSFNADDYEYSQTIVGKAYIQGNIVNGPDFQIGAFCGDECRGFTKPSGGSCTYSTFHLTVHSSQDLGENIYFVLKDPDGNEYDFVNTILFENEAQIGDISLPFLWMDEMLYCSTDFFYFALESGEEGFIDTVTKTINLIITAETSTQNNTPYFVTAPGAKVYVGEELQVSQQSVISLDAPLIYTVTGVDGEIAEWTINTEYISGIEASSERNFAIASISTSGFFNISKNSYSEVEVFDLSGRLIKTIKSPLDEEIYIEASGMFILRLTDMSGKVSVMKIQRL